VKRYCCIHGHFYQPPRENPWLEEIELEDSARPYHDWNERITEECYSQNCASRILGESKKIVDIINNYARMSFDFGPTLLIWLEEHAPQVYAAIIEADRKGRKTFGGHGPAIAQAYNHIIMPLASRRDKETQVIWGIRDFEKRFSRRPEGMWLPETAVDTETLEVLAAHGIKFTILAPHQADKVYKIGTKQWDNSNAETLDTRRAYLCRLGSGRTINLFFYDGKVSHGVAYGGLLHSGETLAEKLVDIGDDATKEAQLCHIATDGETYGHHHRHADMALAYCLSSIEKNDSARITVYGEFLEKFPPTYEVQIAEETSWSCSHGIERWRSDCGCHEGRSEANNQKWRGPLRKAVDRLNGRCAEVYEKQMLCLCSAPRDVRDNYISVINDRSVENVERFMREAAGRELDCQEKVHFSKLLEMERHGMLMLTSCGWFFDDISGIETVQVMQYAARAMQLLLEVNGENFEADFKSILADAPTSRKGYTTGREIYEAFVQPSSIDLNRVGAHFALSAIFHPIQGDSFEIYCYSIQTHEIKRLEAGAQILTTGRAAIKSNITLEKWPVDFAVLHFGDNNLTAAVNGRMNNEKFYDTRAQLAENFGRGNVTEVVRIMNSSFAGQNYSLWHLFKDEQRRILYQLLKSTLAEIDGAFRQIYEHNYSLMQYMHGLNMPLPRALSAAAEFIVNQELLAEIQKEYVKVKRLRNVIDEANRWSLQLDTREVRFQASRKIEELMVRLTQQSENVDLLSLIYSVIRILGSVVPDLDLQKAQNRFFIIRNSKYPLMAKKASEGDEPSRKWVKRFVNLADLLKISVPD